MRSLMGSQKKISIDFSKSRIFPKHHLLVLRSKYGLARKKCKHEQDARKLQGLSSQKVYKCTPPSWLGEKLPWGVRGDFWVFCGYFSVSVQRPRYYSRYQNTLNWVFLKGFRLILAPGSWFSLSHAPYKMAWSWPKSLFWCILVLGSKMR